MTQGQSPTSCGHVRCYSHDHALYPYPSPAAASSTSLAAGLHLAAGPSVEEQEDLELRQGG